MQDGFAWGRTSTSPGCGGFANKAPTGTWLGSWSGGGVYSVVEQAGHDYVLTSADHQVNLSSAAICWTNEYVSVFAETHDYGDALGGDTPNKFNFTAKQFQIAAAGTWMTLPNQCNARVQAADPPFKCSALNGALTIWTDR